MPPTPRSTGPIEALSAVTLVVDDMARSLAFYTALGFRRRYGGADAGFTSLHAGAGYLNLVLRGTPGATGGAAPFGGRVIFHVADADRMHRRAVEHGLAPEAPPRDAPWGERYFHLLDPDGHALSFARPIPDP